MISFQPDICLPKDAAGFGMWRTGHYREHLQFIPLCRALTPPAIITNYDILSWRDEPELVQQWLVAHESIHKQLRVATSITGSDLSLVDFSKDDQFLEWLEEHAQEHRQFRQVLGIT